MKKSTNIIICLVAVVIVACVAFFQESGITDISNPKELTKEQALELILEADDLFFAAFASGFSKDELETAYLWVTNENNRIILEKDYQAERPQGIYTDNFDYYVYFSSDFDTYEEFDKCFLRTFTQDSVESLKSAAEISERNGKLSGYSGYCDSVLNTGDSIEVLSVNINDNTAIVKVEKTYSFTSSDFVECEELKFEYSDEYGWRLDLEKEIDVSNMYTLERTYKKQNLTDFLPERAPEHIRHEDHKKTVLTQEAALDTLFSVNQAKRLMLDFGFEDWLFAAEWASLPQAKVLQGEETSYYSQIYYIPTLDTKEEFDSYFIRIMTEDMLENSKDILDISEHEGKLAIPDYDEKHSSGLIFDMTEIVGVFQEKDSNKAIATAKLYGIDGEFLKTQEFAFEYSEEYGWRADFDSVCDF